MRIVFVCTGNTCRSPMAEALLKEKVRKEGLADRVLISSAGLSAVQGERASENSLLAIREYGLSLEEHRAAMLTREIVEEADLILTMTAGHKLAIIQSMSAAAFKVYTLAEYAGERLDIPDPYGNDLAVYCHCLAAIEENIQLIWDKLLNLVGETYIKNGNMNEGKAVE